MIRTRLAQATAVAALALGTVVILPSAAVAAPATQAVAMAAPATAPDTTVTPSNGTWG